MSAAESKAAEPAAGEPALFAESETQETRMAYEEGTHLPWWVLLVWSVAIIGFIVYVAHYLFPDLSAWGAP